MNNEPKKDFLGNILQEGDAVLFLHRHKYSSELDKGVVVSLSAPKMASVQEKPWRQGMGAQIVKRKYEHLAKITDPAIVEQIKKEINNEQT